MRDLIDEGLTLFNEQKYFEAHEVFEDLWRPAAGDRRLVYQGIVQACASLVKHQRGESGSAITLLRRGLSKLAAAPPGCVPELSIDPLVSELRRVLEALEARRRFDPPAMRRAMDI